MLFRSEFSTDFATVKKDGCHVSGDGACKISVNAMSGDVILRSHKASAGTESEHNHQTEAHSAVEHHDGEHS